MSFVHLHVYSSYSLLSSTTTIKSLVHRAKENGCPAVALTDRNVMYGAIAFYKECLNHKIKPILGLTADIISQRDQNRSFPLVLLARNQKGFQNLIKISSVIQTKSQLGIPVRWLKGYAEGLVGITPGPKGEIEESLMNGDFEYAQECTERYKNVFEKGYFYFSIQKHGLKTDNRLIQEILRLSAETGVQVVATNEVFYLEKEDAFAHECLLAIKTGKKLQDEGLEKLETQEYYLKDPTEMEELFSDIPDALENTLRIASECNVMIELDKKRLPKYPVPEGKTSEEFLEQLCFEGFSKRYKEPGKEHKKRLLYELKVIKEMKFSDYFLIVWDFIKFAREKGILTGPGRGSAAGSMVAYVLYITDVDPIQHNLLFERFLNPERISMPDIDVDFPDNRRDEVIEYVCKKYGQLHVAQIIAFGTMAAKAVLRDVGRAFGFSPKQLDQLSKLVPPRLGITLKDAFRESEGLRDFVNQSPNHKKLFETALKLEGLPRHTSTHAAGVVISEEPLVNTVPIQEGHNGVYLTQYSMDHLEDLGLLKMDFLCLRNLTLLENILKTIYQNAGKRVNIKEIPLNDMKTFQLLSKGLTTGIFQLESEGMRDVLRNLKPARFEDIVAVNALYRPGPMENIPHFINRKNGIEKITYPHPDLKPILENTYGVIVYQEQIMQVASKMANFSLGEADLLRRAVGKKKKEILDQERAHFVKGALNNGYDEKTANHIYDFIVKFANYGFNRSHTVAYSFIAYQLAYLKAHYPLYFMSALLSSVIGNEKKIAQYIREAQEMNITILPPSINKSSFYFLVEKGGIRYSLGAVKGIGLAALREILHAREKGKFKDLFDFCLRVSFKTVNRKTMEALVHSGSFDEFGTDRAVLLASLDVAMEHAQLVMPEGLNQGDLFSGGELSLKPKYVEVEPMRIEDKLNYEKEVLGLYLSAHPVSLYKAYAGTLKIKELSELDINQKHARVMIYINEVRRIRTKRGEAMAFLLISDQSGEMEAVVFPGVYKKLVSNLQKGNILIFKGKVETRNGDRRQFIVQEGIDVQEALEEQGEKEGILYLKIEKELEREEILRTLKELLKENKGSADVILYYESSKRAIKLGMDHRVNPSTECLAQIKKLLGDRNVVLRK